ncbi:hypothetical protein [Novosphingobium olei]|uniref:hypothetical protein n=1 Tax=Novosphingobium olei TaxID=2728851 RepID=UPI0030856CE4|nr:hypothetical protein NSDW_11880 [Novosphingobium olei]
MSVLTAIDTVAPSFWQDFTRRIILAAIKAKYISDAERKERIMLARQCGFISDDECEDFILFWGLVEA